MIGALDELPAGVLSVSEDMRIVGANQSLAALVDRSPEELAGQSIDVILSVPSQIFFQSHVFPALKTEGHLEEVFLTLATRTGHSVPVLFNAARSRGAGDPIYLGTVVRILARSRWEAELVAATRALEGERAASQRLTADLRAANDDLAARHAEEQRIREFRDAFVGVISHELRTPVTTIYGMAHLLHERYESLDREAIGVVLADIESESDRLRRLTEDLLVLSRAEAGKLSLAADPVALTRVVERAVRSETTRSPSHSFALDLADGLPFVLGEELHVEQVVRNFLNNAAKYSPPGTTIDVVATAENGGATVRVIDAGPGLGEGPPERLFEPFHRTPEAVGQATGAGIGLFVCRELVRAMNGRIWAAPAATGSEFGFWLPGLGADDLG